MQAVGTACAKALGQDCDRHGEGQLRGPCGWSRVEEGRGGKGQGQVLQGLRLP